MREFFWTVPSSHPVITGIAIVLGVWLACVLMAICGIKLGAPRWLVTDDPEPERDAQLSARDEAQLLRLHSFSRPAPKGFSRAQVVDLERERAIYAAVRKVKES